MGEGGLRSTGAARSVIPVKSQRKKSPASSMLVSIGKTGLEVMVRSLLGSGSKTETGVIWAVDEPPGELVASAEWDAKEVSVSISVGGRVFPVWFRVSGESPGMETDFLLPLTLFPAMINGSRLKLRGEVSPRLLSAVPEIQNMLYLWGADYWGGDLQDLRRVAVDAEARSERADRAPGVACLFSGGVDSFYTLLKHREEVTHIIFVHGFDIALEDRVLRAQASRMAREVAKELGKTLIEVETNIRRFSDTIVGWEKYHGAAMAGVALLFQRRFRRVLIASSHTYGGLAPWGSHPMLDPLWSTEATEIKHDGSEARRVEKMRHISEHELTMRWLRVCFKNPNGVYNCGHCGKCLLTRITLRTVGALDRCETLPGDLDLEEVTGAGLTSYLNNQSRRGVVRQNLRTLERLGTEPELAQALREVLEKSLETDETRADAAERERLQQRLSLAHEKLDRTRARLEASRTASKKLRARNRLLNVRYSARRYRIADALLGIAFRIPGVRRLAGRRGDRA